MAAIQLMPAAAEAHDDRYRYGPGTRELLHRMSNMFNGYLNITDLMLTSLPEELPAGCRIFHCVQTPFTRLPRLPEGLEELYCHHMPLEELPVLPESLRQIDCGYTQIRELPARLPAALETLQCSGNMQLLALPDSLPASLGRLSCCYTGIKRLPPLPAGLRIFLGDFPAVMGCETFPFNERGGAWPEHFSVLQEPGVAYGRHLNDQPGDWIRRLEQKHEELHAPQRVHSRCRAVKEELMAAAWAPRWGEERLEALVC